MADSDNSPKEGRRVCGAKTRSGGTCQKPPMKGKKRCRLHGGASNKPAPKGNTRALKHGLYSAAISPEERELWDRIEIGNVDEELKLARVRLNRLLILQNSFDAGLVDDASQPTAHQVSGLSIEEMRTLTDGRNRQTEVVRRRRDYQPEINRTLRVISELEKTRAAIGGAGSNDPDELARQLTQAIEAIEEVQEGISEEAQSDNEAA